MMAKRKNFQAYTVNGQAALEAYIIVNELGIGPKFFIGKTQDDQLSSLVFYKIIPGEDDIKNRIPRKGERVEYDQLVKFCKLLRLAYEKHGLDSNHITVEAFIVTDVEPDHCDEPSREEPDDTGDEASSQEVIAILTKILSESPSARVALRGLKD